MKMKEKNKTLYLCGIVYNCGIFREHCHIFAMTIKVQKMEVKKFADV